MPPLLRLKNGYDKLPTLKLIQRATKVKTSMTGNANFPTPSPVTLADLQTFITNLSEAEDLADDGTSYDKEVRDARRAELIDALHSMGYYVCWVANGDPLIVYSASMEVASPASSPLPPSKAENLQLEDGPNAGELALRFKKPQGAKSYIYAYTPSPVTADSVWANQSGTRCKTVLTGLQSGQRYACQVIVVGVGGQQVTSDTVSRVVQ